MRTIARAATTAVLALSAACASVIRLDQALPSSFDPRRVEVVEIATGTSGEVLLRGTMNGSEAAPSAAKALEGRPASPRRGELTTTTSDDARGNAEIRDGDILVDVDRLPALAFMTLRVDGNQLMFFRTDKNGSASLKLARVTK